MEASFRIYNFEIDNLQLKGGRFRYQLSARSLKRTAKDMGQSIGRTISFAVTFM